MTYDELESKPPDPLPDALFHVSSMPSPVAEFLSFSYAGAAITSWS